MVYFTLFLILTIVLPAFFVTAAPVRVTRLTDITEPQARKTLREGLIVLWNAAVSLLAIYKWVFHMYPVTSLNELQTGVWIAWEWRLHQGVSLINSHFFYTQQQSAIPRFPNMEGLASLCDVLNYSQQLLQVNSTEPATAVTALVAEQVYRDACQWVSCNGFCYLSSIFIMLCNIQPCTDPSTCS